MHDFFIGLIGGGVAVFLLVALVIVIGLAGWIDRGSH